MVVLSTCGAVQDVKPAVPFTVIISWSTDCAYPKKNASALLVPVTPPSWFGIEDVEKSLENVAIAPFGFERTVVCVVVLWLMYHSESSVDQESWFRCMKPPVYWQNVVEVPSKSTCRVSATAPEQMTASTKRLACMVAVWENGLGSRVCVQNVSRVCRYQPKHLPIQ